MSLAYKPLRETIGKRPWFFDVMTLELTTNVEIGEQMFVAQNPTDK